MTTQESINQLNADATVSPVLMEWISSGGLPDVARDARIEYIGGASHIVLNDDGDGEYSRVVSESTADKLVRFGLCRDAR